MRRGTAIIITRDSAGYDLYYTKQVTRKNRNIKRVRGKTRKEVVERFIYSMEIIPDTIYCIDNMEREILLKYSEDTFDETNIICITDYEMNDKILSMVRINKSNIVNVNTISLHQTYTYFFENLMREVAS